MGWKHPKIGSMVKKDGYNDLSESLTEITKINISTPYYKILIKIIPVTFYQYLFLIQTMATNNILSEY